jgi:putative FmdB family regulatory protein
MPLYDFKCESCEREIEIFCCINDLEQRRMDERCPSCNGKAHQIIKQARRDWFRVHVN